jgi:hypothetical protein
MTYFELASDLLLATGALAAALYCGVLARRLKRFNNLQGGVGGAVAVLSAQVDDMTKTLNRAQAAAANSAASLTHLTERAEKASRKLELMMASMHDLPEPARTEGEPPSAPQWQEDLLEPDDALPRFLSKRRSRLEAAE